MNTYWIGSIKIECNNIDELRGVVEELDQALIGNIIEYSNKISDFMFAVSADYQAYHNKDQDDWEV